LSEQEAQRKYALECLRMKADCMQLAGEAATPELQRHFLDQAAAWAERAELGPDANNPPPADSDSSSPD
jgi:hypothetical protein